MRRPAKKILLAAAALLLSLSLNGCSISTVSVNSLMQPPAAAGDGAEIQAAMKSELGQFTLRYPRSGQYRSAVVRADIDADGVDEAVAFYRLATESSGASMAILDTGEKSRWKVVGTAPSTGAGAGGDIDRVMFGDLNDDGKPDIVTGWSLFSGASKVIAAYSYADGVLGEIAIDDGSGQQGVVPSYTEMTVGDFDYDGSDEIITVSLNAAEGYSTAQLLKASRPSGGGMTDSCTVRLDSLAVNYISAQTCTIAYNTIGVALDGFRSDGMYMTELICWDRASARLIAPINDPETSRCGFTRALGTLSTDVDGDGVTELPSDDLLPGYTGDDPAALRLTGWSRFSFGEDGSGQFTSVGHTLDFPDEGYYLDFGDDWVGGVTARRDALADIVYFSKVGEDGAGEEFMRIKVFTDKQWDSEDTLEPGFQWIPPIPAEDASDAGEPPRYIMLAKTDYYVYGVLLYGPESDPASDFSTVQEAFHLYE